MAGESAQVSGQVGAPPGPPVGAPAGVTTQSAAAAPPAPPPSTSAPPPPAAGASANAPPASSVGGTPVPAMSNAQAAQAAFNLRNFLAEQLGNPAIAQFQDDQALAQQLASVMRQVPVWQQQASMAAEYSQHADEFRRWQQEQQAAAAARQQTEKKWWNAPEFDPQWLNGVMEDPSTGRLIAKPGYPPEIAAKIERYRLFQRQQLDRFFANPMDVLKPGLEETIAPLIEKAIKENLGSYAQTQQANNYVQQNIGWLVQHDANKAPMRDPISGNYILTPAGQRFQQYVAQLERAGMANASMIPLLAERLVEGDLMRMAYQQNQGQTQQGSAAAAAAAAAPPPPGGANRIAQASQEPPPARLNLGQMLRNNFAVAGITDDIVRNNSR